MLQRHFNEACGRFGSFAGRTAARRPAVCIVAGVVIVFLSALPLLILEVEFVSRPSIFVPANSRASHEARQVEESFGQEPPTTAVLYTSKNKADLLSPDVIKRVWASEMALQQVVSETGKGWSDMCHLTPSGLMTECLVVGLFGIYLMNQNDCTRHGMVKECPHSKPGKAYAGLFTEEQLVYSLRRGDEDGYGINLAGFAAAYLPRFLYARHKSPLARNIFEFPTGTPYPAELTDVHSLLTVYRMNASFSKEDQLSLEKAWGKSLKDRRDTDNAFEVLYYNEDLIAEESANVVNKEIPLLAGTFALMIVFLTISVSRSLRWGLGSRYLLACCVVIQTGLASVFSFGISSALQIPMTMQSPLFVHLLLSVIVDYDIIMVRTFDRMSQELEHAVRFEQAVDRCARTITLTSVTTFCCLLAAALFLDLPAVEWFLVNAALGVIGMWITQFTIFLGFFALDENWKQRKASATAETDNEKQTSEDPAFARDAHFAKLLSTRGARGVSAFLEIVLLAIACALLPSLKTEMDIVTYLPEESPLRQVAERIDDTWGGQFRPAYLVLPGSDKLSYHDPSVRSRVRGILDKLVSDTPAEGPLVSWLHDLQYWEKGNENSCPRKDCPHMMPFECPWVAASLKDNAPPDEFYRYLNEWQTQSRVVCEFAQNTNYSGPGNVEGLRLPWATGVVPKMYWKNDLLKMTSDGSGIVESRLMFTCAYKPGDPKANEETMQLLRQIVKDSGGEDDGMFVWADWFADAERDAGILDTSLTLLLVILCTVVIVLALLLHPIMGGFVGIVLCLVVLQVLGLLAAFGLALDMVAFMVICMAIGFAVEYVTHIAHSFMHQPGCDGAERMRNALEDMGLTVFGAFLSTAVQQLVLLIFAHSYAFTKFCIVMELVVILSGLAGFLLVPTALALGVDVAARLCTGGSKKTEASNGNQ